jgi:hypothetical protein
VETPSLPDLLASAGWATELPRHELSDDRIQSILRHHSKAIVAYHVALELQRVSAGVLSQMTDQRDALFGQGMWLIRNIDDLGDPAHSATVRQTMTSTMWNEGTKVLTPYSFVSDSPSAAYHEQWRSVADQLLLSLEPCSLHDLF